MATVYKTLYQSLLTATTVTTTYAVPGGVDAILGSITFVNASASLSSTIKVWQVPSGATAEGDAYVVLNAITLQPGEKYVLNGPKTITTNAAIKVQASVANVLNCLIEGAEVGAVAPSSWGVAAVKLYKNANQTVANQPTLDSLTWQTEDYDTDSMFDAANPSRITITTPGVYQFNASVVFQNEIGGTNKIAILYRTRAGVETKVGVGAGPAPATVNNYSMATVAAQDSALVGDFYQIRIYQDTGGTTEIMWDPVYPTTFQAARIGYQTNPSLPEACRIYLSANAACPATFGWFALTLLNTVDYDLHSGSAQADTTNGRIYCRRSGVYHVEGALGASPSFTGLKGICFYKNGGISGHGHHHWTDDTSEVYKVISSEIKLVAGDYIQLGFYNPAATARTLQNPYTFLSMSLVRAT